jgi:hypothetical protein
MDEIKWSDPYQMLMVTEEIEGAHPKLANYPLLPEDLVSLYDDGTWAKVGPGMMVTGFVLSPEQVQKLKPVWLQSMHLNYHLIGDVDPDEVEADLYGVPKEEDNGGYSL